MNECFKAILSGHGKADKCTAAVWCKLYFTIVNIVTFRDV